MTTFEFKAITPCFDLGEGPFWDEKSNHLYFVDCFNGDVCRLDVNSNDLKKQHLDDIVTFAVPVSKRDNNLIVSKRNVIVQLNFDSGDWILEVPLANVTSKTRINDGKCDRFGRLWFGTMGLEITPGVVEPNLGSLYTMSNNYRIDKIIDDISLSNGLCWSLDNQRMFYIDSAKRVVYSFNYDLNSGDISGQQDFYNFNDIQKFKSDELPDGMTIDATGKIWIALYNGGKVIQIDPETGTLMRVVDLPSSKTTSVCFGGENLSTLYVTSAFRGLSEAKREAEPESGAVFSVNFPKENIKGTISDRFDNQLVTNADFVV